MPIQSLAVEKLAYWVSFAIPILLMVVSCTTDKLIEGKPWKRKHFYLGIDLTTYFLAACLINVADLARDHTRPPDSYIFTACLIAVAVVILFAQTAFHQEWESEGKSAAGQIVMLCIASNAVGLILLYGFVRLKVEGYL